MTITLEIGSGGNPLRKATVILDKYLIDTEGHRHGQKIKINKPFVQGDGESLPFKMNSFDNVLTRHVIEHVNNIGSFLTEMQRVAHRGYIECPSIVWEFMQPFRTNHKWVFFEIDDTLIISKNNFYNELFSPLIKSMIQGSKSISLFRKSYKNILNIHFHWEKKISYQLEPLNFQELLERWIFNRLKLMDVDGNPEAGYKTDKKLFNFLENVLRFSFKRNL